MNLSNFIEGLQTLAPYYQGGHGYHIGAEHDIFYCYATNEPLSPEDVQKMAGLGWLQEDVELQEDDEWGPEHYDPGEGWAAYV